MGLPEKVAQIGAADTPSLRARLHLKELEGPRALIILPADYFRSADRGQSLGNQFVFGVLPLTRIYFQHGVDATLVEETMQLLADRGFSVALVREADAARSFALLNPALAVRASLLDVGVRALDALFFRAIRFTGTLKIESFEPDERGQLVVAAQSDVPLDETSYWKMAHAPTIATLFRRRVRELAEPALDRQRLLQTNTSLFVNAPEHAAQQPLLALAPPELPPSLAPWLGQELAASYGFKPTHPFSLGAIRRIIQRGLRLGSEERNLSSLSLSQPLSLLNQRSAPSGNLWYVRTAVEQLEITNFDGSAFDGSQGIVLDISFQISENGSSLASGQCSVALEQLADTDGSLLVSTEQATARAFAAFLKGTDETSELIRCRQGDLAGAKQM